MWYVFLVILIAMLLSYLALGLGYRKTWYSYPVRRRKIFADVFGNGFWGIGFVVAIFSVIAELVFISEPGLSARYDNHLLYLISTLGIAVLAGGFGVLMAMLGHLIVEKYLPKKEELIKQKNDFFEALERLEDEKPTRKPIVNMTLEELIDYERID
jgi:hypothetical protein